MPDNIFDTLAQASDDANNSVSDSTATDDSTATNTGDVFTPQAVKQTAQELLKHGLIDATQKPQLYQHARDFHAELNAVLAPLDVRLVIDDVRGLAFLRVLLDEPELEASDWSHPFVRKQRLTLEQSLLIAILRQYYVNHEQNTGVAVTPAVMDVDEVQAQLLTYLGESGSDAKDEKRVRNLLDNLKTHGIVSEVNDQAQFTIRPLIAHLADPKSLQALLQHYRDLAEDK